METNIVRPLCAHRRVVIGVVHDYEDEFGWHAKVREDDARGRYMGRNDDATGWRIKRKVAELKGRRVGVLGASP